MNTQKLGNGSGGFLLDDNDELEEGLEGPGSAKDSRSNDWESVDEYIKALKRRARDHVGGSSMQDKSVILCRPELWMLPVPVRSFLLYS
jgi:hypothetical protein